MNRQTLTYLQLSNIMFKKNAAGVLDQTLAHIAFYCNDNGLPPLTTIVVGKVRGTPGKDIPIKPEEYDMAREKVYKFDWYDIHPPTVSGLLDAYKNNV
ncbi:hypothetical protein AB4552_01000 [Vibrio sp. 10N.222.54.C3]|uniref:hypothetical protein n=1 Tax=unclassified Vibrio TaxID=2614977 RepID=UPI00354DD98A